MDDWGPKEGDGRKLNYGPAKVSGQCFGAINITAACSGNATCFSFCCTGRPVENSVSSAAAFVAPAPSFSGTQVHVQSTNRF